MKKKLLSRLLLYVLIPFILAELLLRIIPVANNFYLSKTDLFYPVKADTNSAGHYYFIGSSHVAVAINEEAINAHLKSDTIIAYNAGRGYSSGTVFYMALKKLADDGLLNNVMVFLEAPRGLPYFSDNRNDSWINENNVHLLIPYLDRQSFIEFWKYSANSFSTKMKLSMNYFFYTIRIGSLIREIFQRNTLEELVTKVFNATIINMHKTEIQPDPNLTDKGGVKTDPTSIANARKSAYAYFKSLAENQKVVDIADWQKSRLNDIIRLLKENNSELILFDMPISSVEAQSFQTKIAKQNITNSFKYLDSQNVRFINFSFLKYADSDFPDLWHLSWAKSVEYSNLLVYEIQHCK
jgi:hypothetical protein